MIEDNLEAGQYENLLRGSRHPIVELTAWCYRDSSTNSTKPVEDLSRVIIILPPCLQRILHRLQQVVV